MVEKITLFLSHTAKDLVEACMVVELIEQAHKKVHVSCSIDKMPARAFKFRLPHLNGHRLSEYLLRKFLLGCRSSRRVLVVVIYYMSSLSSDFDQQSPSALNMQDALEGLLTLTGIR